MEKRYRQRYLDLLMNEETRADFMLRARIVTAIRRYLDDDGLRRGRDADPPAALRRRLRAAVRHPLQRARPGPLPADRDRALPEAPDRRRAREGLRDRQGLPQRGRLLQAQPRVHDARVVRGLRRLPDTMARIEGSSSASRSRRSARRRSPSAATRSSSKRRGSGSVRRRARASTASGRRDDDELRAAPRGPRRRHDARQDVAAARRPRVHALRRAGPDPADDPLRLPGRAVAVRAADRRRRPRSSSGSRSSSAAWSSATRSAS